MKFRIEGYYVSGMQVWHVRHRRWFFWRLVWVTSSWDEAVNWCNMAEKTRRALSSFEAALRGKPSPSTAVTPLKPHRSFTYQTPKDI